MLPKKDWPVSSGLMTQKRFKNVGGFNHHWLLSDILHCSFENDDPESSKVIKILNPRNASTNCISDVAERLWDLRIFRSIRLFWTMWPAAQSVRWLLRSRIGDARHCHCQSLPRCSNAGLLQLSSLLPSNLLRTLRRLARTPMQTTAISYQITKASSGDSCVAFFDGISMPFGKSHDLRMPVKFFNDFTVLYSSDTSANITNATARSPRQLPSPVRTTAHRKSTECLNEDNSRSQQDYSSVANMLQCLAKKHE